jgi:hypothetical protein
MSLHAGIYQARISWGIHGLPKVSLELAMPYYSTPRTGSLWPSYYPLEYPMPYGPRHQSKPSMLSL